MTSVNCQICFTLGECYIMCEVIVYKLPTLRKKLKSSCMIRTPPVLSACIRCIHHLNHTVLFSLQRIFYVLTYIRKKSCEMCHRKFRIQFVVFSVLWKPVRCERWWRSFPAPTLASGKVLICKTVRPVNLSCVWVQLSIELCIYGVTIWDHHFVCMYTHWQF
jgi:hypothetical protein